MVIHNILYHFLTYVLLLYDCAVLLVLMERCILTNSTRRNVPPGNTDCPYACVTVVIICIRNTTACYVLITALKCY